MLISSFSLLITVYIKEKPENLAQCLESVEKSTIKPEQLILVEDGPLTLELDRVIDHFRVKLRIQTVRLPLNRGRPIASNTGLEHCKHEIVARLDSDDIINPKRFELQLSFLEDHPEIAALSSNVQEFDNVSGKPTGLRKLPEIHEDIVKYAKLRCPINHPAVMFRKSPVLAVGGYPTHYPVAFEDYALWLNLILAGHRLANLSQVLVLMRAGAGQSERRRGFRYARQEFAFADSYHKLNFFNFYEYVIFLLFRVPIRFMPKLIVRIFYNFIRFFL